MQLQFFSSSTSNSGFAFPAPVLEISGHLFQEHCEIKGTVLGQHLHSLPKTYFCPLYTPLRTYV